MGWAHGIFSRLAQAYDVPHRISRGPSVDLAEADPAGGVRHMKNPVPGVSSLATLLLILLPPSADALAACKIVDDVGNRFKIGLHQIGTPMLRLMSLEELRLCNAKGSEDAICETTDARGATIRSRLVEPLEESVVQMSSAAVGQNFNGTLIAGVSFGDKMFDAVHKMRVLPWQLADWNIIHKNTGTTFDTGFCLRAGNGTIWSYRLEFDLDGRLISAAATSESSGF
jgi:hypothetical protein